MAYGTAFLVFIFKVLVNLSQIFFNFMSIFKFKYLKKYLKKVILKSLKKSQGKTFVHLRYFKSNVFNPVLVHPVDYSNIFNA